MVMYEDNIKIFCGNSNPEMAANICKHLGYSGVLQGYAYADGVQRSVGSSDA